MREMFLGTENLSLAFGHWSFRGERCAVCELHCRSRNDAANATGACRFFSTNPCCQSATWENLTYVFSRR